MLCSVMELVHQPLHQQSSYALDTERLISLSFYKIASARQQKRGGLNLRRTLLVAGVLIKARNAFKIRAEQQEEYRQPVSGTQTNFHCDVTTNKSNTSACNQYAFDYSASLRVPTTLAVSGISTSDTGIATNQGSQVSLAGPIITDSGEDADSNLCAENCFTVDDLRNNQNAVISLMPQQQDSELSEFSSSYTEPLAADSRCCSCLDCTGVSTGKIVPSQTLLTTSCVNALPAKSFCNARKRSPLQYMEGDQMATNLLSKKTKIADDVELHEDSFMGTVSTEKLQYEVQELKDVKFLDSEGASQFDTRGSEEVVFFPSNDNVYDSSSQISSLVNYFTAGFTDLVGNVDLMKVA